MLSPAWGGELPRRERRWTYLIKELIREDLPTPSSPTRHTRTSRAFLDMVPSLDTTVLPALKLLDGWAEGYGYGCGSKGKGGGGGWRRRSRKESFEEATLLPSSPQLRLRMAQGFKAKAPIKNLQKTKSTTTKKVQPKDTKKGGTNTFFSCCPRRKQAS